MDERSIDCAMLKFEGLRDRQYRRRRGHGRACQGHNGANGAEIIRMLIRIGTRRRQLLSRMYRRRCLRCDRVDVTKRQGELDDEREQRQPRAKSDVRPHPFHVDDAPRRKPYTPQAPCVTL